MKKLLGFLFVASSGLTLAACNKDNTEVKPEEQPGAEHLPGVDQKLPNESEGHLPGDNQNVPSENTGASFESMKHMFNAQGFATRGITDVFSSISETDSEQYAKVSTAHQLIEAIYNAQNVDRMAPAGALPEVVEAHTGTGKIKVIELTDDIDLGYNVVKSQVIANSNGDVNAMAKYGTVIRERTKKGAAKAHPLLMETGVSTIDIQYTENLIIMSKNGSKITHGTFIIKNYAKNIVMRNLAMDEIWEWDDVTVGDYDANDWDYITIQGGKINPENKSELLQGKVVDGVWIDHCTFGKAYDGTVDVKDAALNVSITWNKFLAEAKTHSDFYKQQFDYLEANMDKFPYYKSFRDNGLSKEQLMLIFGGQKKGHLIGSSEASSASHDNAKINGYYDVTIANNYYEDLQDRLPRLRTGNAHVYNVYLDASKVQEGKDLLEVQYKAACDVIKAQKTIDYLPEDATLRALYLEYGYYVKYKSTSDKTEVPLTAKCGVTSQALVTTENGAVQYENVHIKGVLAPVKNNQKSGTAYESWYTGKYNIVNTIYELGDTKVIENSSSKDLVWFANASQGVLGVANENFYNFSWNKFEVLPYSYDLIDVNELSTILPDSQLGSGAGVLSLTSQQWRTFTY